MPKRTAKMPLIKAIKRAIKIWFSKIMGLGLKYKIKLFERSLKYYRPFSAFVDNKTTINGPAATISSKAVS